MHDMMFYLTEIIENDITNEEPVRFKKIYILEFEL